MHRTRQQAARETQTDMHIRTCTDFARRSWWLLVLGALFALASYGVALRIVGDGDDPAVYRSTATVFVSAERSAAPPLMPAADGADMERLAASYAAMIEGRTVSERFAAYLRRGAESQSLRDRIDARAVPGTQLIEVSTNGATAEEAETLANGVSNAFVALHAERGLPGATSVYEVSVAQPLAQDERSPLFTATLVALAGVVAAAAVVGAYTRLSARRAPSAQESTGAQPRPLRQRQRRARSSLATESASNTDVS
jgi:capsular polysaccharide biosynthesis protein